MAEIKAINVNGTPYDINLKDGKTLSINGLTVSGTASLTGTTTINSLTLGGDLNGNNKSISGINSISCATISATTANLSVNCSAQYYTFSRVSADQEAAISPDENLAIYCTDFAGSGGYLNIKAIDANKKATYKFKIIPDGTDKINTYELVMPNKSGNLALLETVYPVGAIYISTISTSPHILFGFGTWQEINGQFLFAQNSAYPAGSVGGSDTHALTIDEMPSHSHSVTAISGTQVAGMSYLARANDYSVVSTYEMGVPSGKWYDVANLSTGSKGGSQDFSIMPPYLSVYMWKRTA